MKNQEASLLAFLLLITIPAMSTGGVALQLRRLVIGGKTAPTVQSGSEKTYAVIFDAGSTGSRVHVYCFDENLDLVSINGSLEVFVKVKPGLSAYADNPQEAANSLLPLLEKAESAVPEDLRPKTTVRLGATAGLRLIGEEASEKILEAVRELLENRSTLRYNENEVTVLDGTQEGSYLWVTTNYLLGNLGKKYWDTVGSIDLGGGSVQMAYAISEKQAASAPVVDEGESPYVTEMYLKGRKYYIYVHSYLNYGFLAARTQMFEISGNDSANPCILAGFDGYYKYNGATYKAKALPSGSSFKECRGVAIDALKLNATCKYSDCTFGGVWSGGLGAGRRHLFAASFFYELPSEVGLIDPNAATAKVHPLDFKKAAKIACATNLEDAKSKYPLRKEAYLPYLCMDLVYLYTLLVDGFGLRPGRTITVGARIKYQNSEVEAAWPLGSAIEAVSSQTGSQVYLINLAKNHNLGKISQVV